MNKQEIFETIKKAALKQNKKSRNEKTGYCLFRGEDGTKCHIGHLIKDEFYDEAWNTEDLENIDVRHAIVNSGVKLDLALNKSTLNEDDRNTDDFLFISQLQQIHDHFEPSAWAEQFNRFEETWLK